MADITRSVSIIFGATDNAGPVISGVASKMESLRNDVNDVAQPLADVANSILKLDAALGTLAAGGMALAVTKAAEFETQFKEIQSIADIPVQAVGKFEKSIEDYASGSTKSIKDINGAIYEAISSGVKYDDSLKVLAESEKLSVAGKADLTSTTKVLVSTLNAYGEGMDKAGKYSDIMFQTVKLGQTTIPELTQSLSQVSTVAVAGKVPFETLSAAMAALTVQGYPTAEAATAVKAALSNIIKPSSEAQEEAKKLGIEFNATALATKGFEGVLQDAYKATGGNVDKMAKLFGSTEALGGVMALAADKSGKFSEALTAMQSASGATDAAFKIVKDSLSSVTQQLVNNIELVVKAIGKELIPATKNVEEGFIGVFKGLKKAVDADAFKPLFDVLDKFGVALKAELEKIGENLPLALKNINYDKLIESVSGLGTSLKKAFDALFAGIDLTTPEGLTRAIQKLVDGFTSLTNITTGIVDAWKPFLSAVGSLVDWFTKLDAAQQKSAGNWLGVAQQVAAVTTAFGAVIAAIGLVGTGLTTLSNLLPAASLGLSTLGTSVTTVTAMLGKLTLGVLAFQQGMNIGKILYEHNPYVRAFGDELGKCVWQLVHFNNTIAATTEKQTKQAEATREYAEKVKELAGKYKELPDEKTIDLEAKGLQEAIDKARTLGAKIADVPREKLVELLLKTDEQKATDFSKALDAATKDKVVNIKPYLDEKELKYFKENIRSLSVDQTVNFVSKVDKDKLAEVASDIKSKVPSEKVTDIVARLNSMGFTEAAAAISKAIPEKKEVKVEMDPAKVLDAAKEIGKAFLDVEKSKIEWTAKLNIAQLEADTKRIEAAFNSITEGIKSTGSVLGNLFTLLGMVDSSPNLSPSRIEKYIEKEYEMRKQAFDLQEKLTNAQIASMNARTKALLNGDGLIKIDTKGLTPSLEMVLTEIVKKLQLKVSQAGGDMLIGASK